MAVEISEILNAYTELFEGLTYLGPADTEFTQSVAAGVSGDLPSRPVVVDFGCGVGASSIALANVIPTAHIIAMDMHRPFLTRLKFSASNCNLGNRIDAVAGDMSKPPIKNRALDLIWCESSIYAIGRVNAFNSWNSILKPGGWLVFSDIVWHPQQAEHTSRAEDFWKNEYSDITNSETVLQQLKTAGFEPDEPLLPGSGVWENYYQPLKQRTRQLAARKDNSRALNQILAEMNQEIQIHYHSGSTVDVAFFKARWNGDKRH